MSDFDYRCLDCKHEWDEEDGATWPARCPSCGSGSIEDPDDEGPPEIAADTTSSNPWDGVERRAKFHDLPGSPFAFRRFATHPPLVEGAAYGTSMVERRTVKDRRRVMALAHFAGSFARRIKASTASVPRRAAFSATSG
jgi:hypothetical protein